MDAPPRTPTLLLSIVPALVACTSNRGAPADEHRRPPRPRLTCGADQRGGGDLPYCVALPAGVTEVGRSAAAVKYQGMDEPAARLSVLVALPDASTARGMLKHSATVVRQGELPGHGGEFVVSRDGPIVHATAVYTPATGPIVCDTSWPASQAAVGAALTEACLHLTVQ